MRRVFWVCEEKKKKKKKKLKKLDRLVWIDSDADADAVYLYLGYSRLGNEVTKNAVDWLAPDDDLVWVFGAQHRRW